VVTFGEDGVSGHPDHRAVHHWTRRAWAAEGRPGALWYVAITEETAANSPRPGLVGRPGPEIAAVLDGRPWLDMKEAAIRCHASQHFPLPLDTPDWRDRVAREVFGREGFRAGAAPPATDWFSLDTTISPQ
jgi:LmbE family N-acetylglucosaminyl deacetylase